MPHTAEEWDRWGGDRPIREAQFVAVDVTKQPSRVVLLAPSGALEPLPGDLDRTPVNVSTRRGDFHCLVAGCGPFKSAVAAKQRRHHFRHATAPSGGRPGHDPETMHHANAKHELAAWLRRTVGQHLILLSVDEQRISTQHGTAKPDVYAELDTGARIAIEYQHSPGDALTVHTKSIGYAGEGITCWWLFGPFRHTCQKTGPPAGSGKQTTFVPTPVQKNLIDRGITFHWFSAEDRRIGTPVNVGRRRISPVHHDEDWEEDRPKTTHHYPQRPWPRTNWVLMDDAALDECMINLKTGGLETPTDRKIMSCWHQGDREIRQLRAEARRRHDERRSAETSVPVLNAPNPWPVEPNPWPVETAQVEVGVEHVPEPPPQAAPSEPQQQPELRPVRVPMGAQVQPTPTSPATPSPSPHSSSAEITTPEVCRRPWWKRLLGIPD